MNYRIIPGVQRGRLQRATRHDCPPPFRRSGKGDTVIFPDRPRSYRDRKKSRKIVITDQIDSYRNSHFLKQISIKHKSKLSAANIKTSNRIGRYRHPLHKINITNRIGVLMLPTRRPLHLIPHSLQFTKGDRNQLPVLLPGNFVFQGWIIDWIGG